MDPEAVEQVIDALFSQHPSLVTLSDVGEEVPLLDAQKVDDVVKRRRGKS